VREQIFQKYAVFQKHFCIKENKTKINRQERNVCILQGIFLGSQDKREWGKCGMKEMRNAYKILIRKPASKRCFGKSICIYDNNTKMGIKAVSCDVLKWIHLAQRRV
jgi:hypothetical protein